MQVHNKTVYLHIGYNNLKKRGNTMIKARFNLFKTRQKGFNIWFVKYSAPIFCGFKLFANVNDLYHWLKFQGAEWVYDENLPLTDVLEIISKMTVFYTVLDTHEIQGY